MAKRPLDIEAEIAGLTGLTLYELRQTWKRICRTPAPMRYSVDLLIRGITYKIQERAVGVLSKSQLRKLDRVGDTVAVTAQPKRPAHVIKPGTRLVREWHGVTHTVLVLAEGVEWQGQRYRSLTMIAREITGAHWSGPRFFGLTNREHRSDE